ncbi:MAG: hypothetical protein OXP28_05495 [Gammaproteobacteria bacterium]|nr:hypothetical protein [Gammaproteobacteria bacterium]
MRMNLDAIARFLPPAFLARSWPQATMIVCLGCLQMAGDIFDLPVVKAFGAVSHISPAPKVFTTQNGFETFSSTFVLHAWDKKHGVTALPLTPEVNALVRGPYNRRNAYGAALSYGPVLARSPRTAPMFWSVLQFGLCSDQGVAADLGLAGRRHYAVEVSPHDRNPAHESPIRFQVDCETEPVTEDTQ